YICLHRRNRTVTLNGSPTASRDEHFYEKYPPVFTPAWVEKFPVPRRDPRRPDIRYILINNRATLVWLSNLAGLEIHPFLHRVPGINTPTMVDFDCDPGEGADIYTCARVALLLTGNS